MAMSLEVSFNGLPNGFIFKNKGYISNISRYEQIEFNLNTKNLDNKTSLLKENLDDLLKLCTKHQTAINCDILEIFLKNKIIDIESKNSFRKKRGCLCEIIRELISGAPVNQEVIDQIQNDIRYNRNLILNSTQLLNKTVNTQNEINDAIFSEISQLKNVSSENQSQGNFLGLIQSILMVINDESDTTNAIIGLLTTPHYTQVLKLIGFDKMDKQLCEIQNSLNKNESLASRKDTNIVKALTLSQVKVDKTINGVLIKMKIPIINGRWPIFKILPISFKGESGPRALYTRYKYIVLGKNKSYALLSADKQQTCQRYREQTICLFGFKKTKSCEYDAFIGKSITNCTTTTSKLPKIMRANNTHVYAAIGNETTLNWQCDGLEHTFKLNKSAWIQLNHRCKLHLLSGPDGKTIWSHKVKTNITTIPFNVSHWTFVEPKQSDDNTSTTTPSLRKLQTDVEKAHDDAKKPIEKITIAHSIVEMIIRISVLIIGIALTTFIVKRLLCNNKVHPST